MPEMLFVRLCEVVAAQRALAISIGIRKARELSEHHGLDDGKTLPGSIIEIPFRILPIQPVE
jgi:hypothetical protein